MMREPKPMKEPQPIDLLFDEHERVPKKVKSRGRRVPWMGIFGLIILVCSVLIVFYIIITAPPHSGTVTDKHIENNETFVLTISTGCGCGKEKELVVSQEQYTNIHIGDDIKWDANDRITEIHHR